MNEDILEVVCRCIMTKTLLQKSNLTFSQQAHLTSQLTSSDKKELWCEHCLNTGVDPMPWTEIGRKRSGA